MDLLSKILRIFQVEQEIFKKILGFTIEKDKIAKDQNVKELFKKKIFLIDLLFFVIFAKNNRLFD